MSQHTSDEPDPAEIRSALATLVAAEPALPSGTEDIERRGRRRLARRRLAGGLAVVAVTAVGLAATNLGGLGTGAAPNAPVAAPPTAAVAGPADSGGAGGSQLAGFTVGAAVSAVTAVLPAGVGIADLPVDIGWGVGGTLDLPLKTATGAGTLTLRIADGTCTAAVSPVDGLNTGDLKAVSAAVCAAWIAEGSPAIVPAGASGGEQPELANQ